MHRAWLAFFKGKLTKKTTPNPLEPHCNLTSSATALSGSQEHCTATGKKKSG